MCQRDKARSKVLVKLVEQSMKWELPPVPTKRQQEVLGGKRMRDNREGNRTSLEEKKSSLARAVYSERTVKCGAP